MASMTTAIGLAAAVCTTASYLPQLKKAWSTGDTKDLSLKMLLMLLMLLAGLCLWIVYGVMQGDLVLMLANSVSVALLAGILYCKLTQKDG